MSLLSSKLTSLLSLQVTASISPPVQRETWTLKKADSLSLDCMLTGSLRSPGTRMSLSIRTAEAPGTLDPYCYFYSASAMTFFVLMQHFWSLEAVS